MSMGGPRSFVVAVLAGLLLAGCSADDAASSANTASPSPAEARSPSEGAAQGDAHAVLPDGGPPSRELRSLREDARYVLETHCGRCHREDSPEAKQAALEVFNLNDEAWAASMSPAQLRDLALRIEQSGATSDADRRTIARYVRAELARRGVEPADAEGSQDAAAN